MLTPYLPYPLLSGGQIRTYNLLKKLAKKHEITLFALIKNQEEKQYIPELEKFCKKVKVFQRSEKPFTIKNILKALFSTYPFLVIRNYVPETIDAIKDELSKEKYEKWWWVPKKMLKLKSLPCFNWAKKSGKGAVDTYDDLAEACNEVVKTSLKVKRKFDCSIIMADIQKKKQATKLKRVKSFINATDRCSNFQSKSSKFKIVEVATTALNVRKKENTSSQIVTTLDRGTFLRVVNSSKDWLKIIDHKCKIGWVVKYLTKNVQPK